jgi:large subunit ribosomal protein L24
MARKIKQGDEVIVIAGKNKGLRGRVSKVLFSDLRVFVEGIYLKKHEKPNPQRGIEGGIVEKPASVHLSNVAMYNPETKKAGKVGFKLLEDGRKIRYFKSNGELVDVAEA